MKLRKVQPASSPSALYNSDIELLVQETASLLVFCQYLTDGSRAAAGGRM